MQTHANLIAAKFWKKKKQFKIYLMIWY
jgi:hypothetical protein